MKRMMTLLTCVMCILSASTVFAQSGSANKPVLPYTPALEPAFMDKSVDPCADLYTYACGGWVKQNPIPGDQASWSVYGKLADENFTFLRQILEHDASTTSGLSPVEKKIGDYYAACTDEAAIDKAGISPLQPLLKKIAALKSPKDLGALVAELHLVTEGSGTLFGFGSEQDFKNSKSVIAGWRQGGLGLPDRDYYLDDTDKMKQNRAKYLAYVQQILELSGEATAQAQADAQNIMRMETELAKASQTRVARRNPDNVYHKMSVEEAAALAPNFDFKAYLAGSGVAGAVHEVNVGSPDFVKELNVLLEKEPLANWQAYLRFHLVSNKANFLSSNFVNANFEFYSKYLRGVQQLQPRWKRCVRSVDNLLGEALGQAYVKAAFPPDAKARAQKMVDEIEKAMAEDINALDWMSASTKPQAMDKLKRMVNKIGYPDKWRDYSSVVVDRKDYLKSASNAIVFESRRDLNKIGKPVDRGEWGMTPPTVNAYYDPQMNDINFPAGVLQPPLFDPKLDDAPNYGDTGSTIGHELTHGFDDEGSRFDGEGNLRDWWTKEDKAEFDKRTSCVADQYAQYVIVDDIKINSRLTLGEDVADVGGLILAWMAWKDHTKGADLKPMDGFTPEQRFFIGYTQQWCTNERDENKRVRAKTDPHSPAKYRVNGVVVNMPEFQQAFSCKTGAPLAPEKRCRVW